MNTTPAKGKKRRMRLPNGIGSVHKIGGKEQRRNPWRARVPDKTVYCKDTDTWKRTYIIIGYFPTEKDAITALFDYQRNPYTAEAASITFAEVFDMWSARKFPTVSESTRSVYTAAYHNSTPLHDLRMRDIRTGHMEQIILSTPLKYSSQKAMKTLWHQLFEYASEHDIVEKNYAAFVKLKDGDPGTNRSAIPQKDIDQIWRQADAGNWAAQIFLIYIYTGMRANELLTMRKDSVDLSQRIMVGGLKTAAGKNRRIPIHRDIRPIIAQLMQTPGAHLISPPGQDADQVLSYDSWAGVHLPALMKQLDMPYTCHYARHTCATMLREAEVEEDLRKLILGHANGDVTARYTHHSDELLLSAIDKIPLRCTI